MVGELGDRSGNNLQTRKARYKTPDLEIGKKTMKLCKKKRNALFERKDSVKDQNEKTKLEKVETTDLGSKMSALGE